MIIWINGAFGSGKTQTAFELKRHLQDAFVYDPENIGYFIRENIPEQVKQSDFQDYPMWRDFNYKMLKYMDEVYRGPVIVPMTVTNKQYYDELIRKLRLEQVEVHHYILYANKSTVLKRLRKRLEYETSWAAQQIDRCLVAFQNEITEGIIQTDAMTIDEVVLEIARRSNLTLVPDRRSAIKKKLDRIYTMIKHIR
ncbi:AAA family ATPase [Zhenhengia yiwuensis]|uniref:AAA family ATPase n=1 Tax=Zhenhengia yiwuensis TaxID=2763666 RepID=UPI002A760EF9|nr:AAA family ATPase [Zhenhengia yiwuensis]MDY3367467.1 AAA family ATPase [Zhenhengia yiwuensis]